MADDQALNEFWNTPAPFSQVQGRGFANGWYNLLFAKFSPLFDDNGLLFIKAEITLTAPEEMKGRQKIENLYIGTHKDPKATLPETQKGAPGYSFLKDAAAVCGVPFNDQSPGALCGALLNKEATGRMESKPSKKDKEKSYTNITRLVKLGAVPARIDGTPAVGAANGSMAPAVSEAPAGVSFGSE